jgi:hemerythrin superfamily protein
MATEVLKMLEADHRHVEGLFESLRSTDDPAEREQLVRELGKALAVHMQFEEEHLYPLLQQVDDEMSEEGHIEHQLGRDGLVTLSGLVNAPGFGAALEMLAAGILHHVKEEEHEAFPLLRKHYGASRLESLGRTLLTEKQKTGTLVPPDATKEELLELAREQGIDGRSSMSKDELREALESA